MKSKKPSTLKDAKPKLTGYGFKATEPPSGQKNSISSCSGFLSGLPCFAGTGGGHRVSMSQLKQDLLACKKAFDLLPPQSRYARSRKSIIDMHLSHLEEFDCEGSELHDLSAWMEKLHV